MAAFILLVVALILSIFIVFRFEHPVLNIRWAVVACLIGAMLAGMPVPGLR